MKTQRLKINKKNKRQTVKKGGGVHIIKTKTPKHILRFTNSIPNGRSGGPKVMSYRPSINKELPKLVSLAPKDIKYGDCYNELERKATISLTYGESTPSINYPTPKIAIPECLKISDPKAKKRLLENAYSKRLVPASKITAPLQYLSNCWFNSGFMAMFVSDKGRDFNRSFRHSMIVGKILGKKGTYTIPTKLRNALGYFAIAIDACLRGDPIMHKLNTNHLLLAIYKAIPKSKLPQDIKESKLDDASNPIPYYKALYNYLYGNKVGAFPIKYLELYNLPLSKGTFDFMSVFMNSIKGDTENLPDLFVVEIFNNQEGETRQSDPSKMIINKPLKFKLGKAQYSLDSTLVRDVTNSHLCATLTYGGKQYGFDGESLHRMDPFSWKRYLNKDKRWSFKGSTWKGTGLPGKNGSQVYWNYRDGYQALYYYRIK